MNEEPIAARVAKLEAMRSKAFALGGPLGNLLSKSFDLLTNVVRKSTEDRKSLSYALESFSNERRFAESKDAERNDRLRHVVYGLTEGIEMMGSAMIEEWNEAEETKMKKKKEEKMEDEAINSSTRSNSVITPHPSSQAKEDSGREAAVVSQPAIPAQQTPTVSRPDQRQSSTVPVEQTLAAARVKSVPHQQSGLTNDGQSAVQVPQPQPPSENPAPVDQQDSPEIESAAQEAETLQTPSATRESTPAALKTPKRKPTLLDTYFNSAKKAKKVLDDDDIIVVEEAAAAPAAPATPTTAKIRAAPAAETPAAAAAAADASETPAGAPLDPDATDRKSRTKRKSERRSKREKIDATAEPATPAASSDPAAAAAVAAATPAAAGKPAMVAAASSRKDQSDAVPETPDAKKRDEAAATSAATPGKAAASSKKQGAPTAVATPTAAAPAQTPVAATTPATAKRVSSRTGRRSVRAPQLEEVTTFKCDFEGCEESFDTKKKLGTHALKHTGIQCDRCGNYMKNQASFIEHLLRIHNIDVIAEQAQGEKANKENNVQKKEVEKKRTAEKPEHKSIQCNECGDYVKNEASFIEHLLKIHNIDVYADNQGEKENKENEKQEEEQVEKERRAEQPERQMEMEEADEPSASLEEAVTPAAATPSDRKRRRTEKGRDGRKKEKNDEEARTVRTPKTDGAVKQSQWSSFVDRSRKRDEEEQMRDGNGNGEDDDEVRKTKRDAASKKSRRSSVRDRSLTSDDENSESIAPNDDEEPNVDKLHEKIANPASAKKRRRPKPKRRPTVIEDDAMMDLVDHKDTPSRPRRSRINSDPDKVAEDARSPYDDDVFDKEDYPDVKKADVMRFISFCIGIMGERKPNVEMGELVQIVEMKDDERVQSGKILADDKKVNNEANGSTPATPILAPIFNRSISRGQAQSAKLSLLSSAVKESYNEDIEGAGRFHCPQCDVTRSTESTMTAHLRDAHGVKAYSCGQCEKTFAKKLELMHHQKRHQEKTEDEKEKDNVVDEDDMKDKNEEEKIEAKEKRDDDREEEDVLEDKENDIPDEEDLEMRETSEETEMVDKAEGEEVPREKEKHKEDYENIEQNEDQKTSEETENFDEDRVEDAIEEKKEENEKNDEGNETIYDEVKEIGEERHERMEDEKKEEVKENKDEETAEDENVEEQEEAIEMKDEHKKNKEKIDEAMATDENVKDDKDENEEDKENIR